MLSVAVSSAVAPRCAPPSRATSQWAVIAGNAVLVLAIVTAALLAMAFSLFPTVPRMHVATLTSQRMASRIDVVSRQQLRDIAKLRALQASAQDAGAGIIAEPAGERWATQLYSGMVEPQRPWPGERDAVDRDASFAYVRDAGLMSLNPPSIALAALDATSRAELRRRLVIAIACGVHSGRLGSAGVSVDAIEQLPVIAVLLTSWLPALQPHHTYRFYFAYDVDDPVYSRPDIRRAIEQAWAARLHDGNLRRWHPSDREASAVVDDTTLVATLHWVRCPYSGRPSWAHSDAVLIAYAEGADYAFRTNDDSEAPSSRDAVDRFIINLRSRTPFSNLGAVGPMCEEGAPWILTHDFTHRTHAHVFGFHYPRSLPDWSSDDFITYAYEQYGLAHKLPDVQLVHHVKFLGRRYTPSDRAARRAALREAILYAATAIDSWAHARCRCALKRVAVHIRSGKRVDFSVDANLELEERDASGAAVKLDPQAYLNVWRLPPPPVKRAATAQP